ncbi:MAG: acyl carrier protein [Legionella sp.]
MTTSIEQRIIHLIARAQNISPEEIQLDKSIEQFCHSSLDLVNFLFDLEDEFDLDIRSEIDKDKTIRERGLDIEQLIAKHPQEVQIA